MHARHQLNFFDSRLILSVAAMLALVPRTQGQSVDFSPAALSNQRSALILKANKSPLTDLENDVNHLAVLSETCRAESGSKACGLSDKPIAATALEDRYDYYVRKPMEDHASARQAKIDRKNWEAATTASR